MLTRSQFSFATIAAAALIALFAGETGISVATPARAQAAAPPPAAAQCRACHTVEKDGKNGVGPNLFGVFNRPAASKPGFAYSPAMKAANIRWTRAELEAFLTAPVKRVPGTRMASPPMADAAKRKAVLDYLASLK